MFKMKDNNLRVTQKISGFYGIASDHFKEQGWDHVKCAELLLRSRVKTVQCLFDIFPDYDKAVEEAKRVRELCTVNDALFLITVYRQPLTALKVMRASDADGIHYGGNSGLLDLPLEEAREKLKDKVMGITVHDIKGAQDAETAGADYLGTDAIFPSLRHRPNDKPLGLDGLKSIIDSVRIPVIAAGGIMPNHVPEIKRLGAAGFVVISPVFKPEQGKIPESVVAEYRKAWNDA